MKLKQLLQEKKKDKKIKPDMKLKAGEKIVLQADTDEHARGLVVKWRKTGGYDVYYW